jgi:hypothetical protein
MSEVYEKNTKMISPATGRPILIGGVAWRNLVKSGSIAGVYTQPTSTQTKILKQSNLSQRISKKIIKIDIDEDGEGEGDGEDGEDGEDSDEEIFAMKSRLSKVRDKELGRKAGRPKNKKFVTSFINIESDSDTE